MQLKVLSYNDVEQARIWRNDNMSMNRTPYLLTPEMQGKFYQEIICNRNANARYWGIWEDTESSNPFSQDLKSNINTFIGMGEITNISPENRNGEIGLLMHPGYVYMANEAIDLILEQGFSYLNLENIYGEVYMCSAYLEIWKNAIVKYNPPCCYLPNRKYWNGQYYDSLYFNINKGDLHEKCI